MTKVQLFLSGHGGQGVLLLGDYIAYSAMLDGKHVVYTPSYGPETRGGKAKCYVIISEDEIDTPIPEEPDIMIIMNRPSMEFVPQLARGGLLIYNSSLIDTKPKRSDISAVAVPATEIADSLKENPDHAMPEGVRDTRLVANAVMFGAYLGTPAGQTAAKHLDKTLEHFLAGKKSGMFDLNLRAVKRGLEHFTSVTATPALNIAQQ